MGPGPGPSLVDHVLAPRQTIPVIFRLTENDIRRAWDVYPVAKPMT